jgi:hypothetical protein
MFLVFMSFVKLAHNGLDIMRVRLSFCLLKEERLTNKTYTSLSPETK